MHYISKGNQFYDQFDGTSIIELFEGKWVTWHIGMSRACHAKGRQFVSREGRFSENKYEILKFKFNRIGYDLF